MKAKFFKPVEGGDVRGFNLPETCYDESTDWGRTLHPFVTYRYGSAGTVEILDIKTYRRREGHGRLLVQAVVDAVTESGQRRTVYAFTRASNTGARAFYKALGFRESAIISRFYQDSDEPADRVGVMYCKEVGRG